MKLGMRFLRHRGIFRSDVVIQILKSWGRGAAPRWSDPGPAKGRDGRTAPCSSSTMSSGRLFLDRVARQHGPSPLHRQAHPKTVSGWGTMNLQRTANSVLTVCLSQGDNRRLPSCNTGARTGRLRLYRCLTPSVLVSVCFHATNITGIDRLRNINLTSINYGSACLREWGTAMPVARVGGFSPLAPGSTHRTSFTEALRAR